MDDQPSLPSWVDRYLAHLADCGTKYIAADRAGVKLSAVREYRQNHPAFKEAEADALGRDADNIEETLRERAIRGFDEVTRERGAFVDPVTKEEKEGLVETKRVRKFSNDLLLALARAKIPEFREKATVDVSLHTGVLVVPPAVKTAGEWDKIASGNLPAPGQEGPPTSPPAA